MWVCVDDFPPYALNFFFRKGHFDQRFFSSTRSIITATADDRRRRHSKIIELFQSRPPQNPLFFHSWALLVSLTLADQPSFSGLRTLVLLSFSLSSPLSSPDYSFGLFPRSLLPSALCRHLIRSTCDIVVSSRFLADAMDPRQSLRPRDDTSGTDEFVKLIADPFRTSVRFPW